MQVETLLVSDAENQEYAEIYDNLSEVRAVSHDQVHQNIIALQLEKQPTLRLDLRRPSS